MTRCFVAISFAAFAAVAFAAAACGGRGVSASCPTVATALRLPRSPVLQGDIAGDRRPDRVFLAYDRLAPTQCRVLLVVTTGSHALSRQLPSVGPPPIIGTHWKGPPALEALVRLDRMGKLGIGVSVGYGASTAGVSVLRVQRGRLVAVLRPGGSFLGGTFVYGGVVSQLEGVDCTPGSFRQLNAGASDSGRRWQIRSAVFTVRGTHFIPRSRRTWTFVGGFAALQRKFPALGSRPFRGCSAARAGIG